MKNYSFKLISFILTLIILFSSLPVCANANETKSNQIVYSDDTFTMYIDENGHYRFYGVTGDMSKGDSNPDYVIKSSDDYYKSQGKKDIAATGSSSLPQSVDLSQTKYFPPVGDQGGLGSCATFSCVYYQFSYEFNKQLDRQATYENTMSPEIVYNLVSGASNDGTTYEGNYKFLKHFGALPMSVLPYTDQVHLDWYAEEKYWSEALKYRLDSYAELDEIGVNDKQITSPDDPDLIPLKTALNDGKVVGYSTTISSWVGSRLKQNPLAPENANHKDEHVILYKDGTNGPHRMAIVGYNDNIWTDINNNDKVDAGEMGALKIVNSWGEGYCNSGFAWVAYDALNSVTSVNGGFSASSRRPIIEHMTTINVREYNPEGSKAYFCYTLNTANRIQHEVVVSAEKDGTTKSYQVFYGSVPYKNERNDGGFDGSKNASDGTFCVPIDLVFENYNSNDFTEYTFSITARDINEDGNPVTIKDAKIVNTVTNQHYYADYDLPQTVDGNEVSFTIKESESKNKVIYYIGYDNPTLHYSIDGTNFEQVKMNKYIDNVGAEYQYILKNATEDITLYFTDDNGNIDNNSGTMYTAKDRINYYRTKDVRLPVTITDFKLPEDFDVNYRFYPEGFTTNGYEPYNYQFTFTEKATGNVKTIPFETNLDKSHVFYYAGWYTIKIEVIDQAGDYYVFEKDYDIPDNPFKFKTFISNQKTHFVGNTSSFTANSMCESVISRGNIKSLYKFDVKDENGEIVYTKTNKATRYHLGERWSISDFSFIPAKSGKYTLTVSSTDGNNEYAEISLDFEVFDKIYGDSNSDGLVSVMDATFIQRMLAGNVTEDDVNTELADVDANTQVDVLDATLIQRYMAQLSGTKNAGIIIEYIPPVEETPEPTQPTPEPTQPPNDPPVTKNMVTFTNSFNWSGTISCYYWSDTNMAMTTWPGMKMTYIETNDFGQAMYTFEVPQGATYIIFTNGSSQTVDIPYAGGEIRYYPIASTDSKGHNLVQTW